MMRILSFWKPLLWLAIIATLSLMPSNKLPRVPILPHTDKLVHAVMYGVLALLLMRPIRKYTTAYDWVIALIVSTIIGGAIEIVQSQMAYKRSGDWYDFIANAAGAVLGVVFFRLLVAGRRWERVL